MVTWTLPCVLIWTVPFLIVLQTHFAIHCTARHYNILLHMQHTATHCNTLQHTATHCNTLQHMATLCVSTLLCVLICKSRTQGITTQDRDTSHRNTASQASSSCRNCGLAGSFPRPNPRRYGLMSPPPPTPTIRQPHAFIFPILHHHTQHPEILHYLNSHALRYSPYAPEQTHGKLSRDLQICPYFQILILHPRILILYPRFSRSFEIVFGELVDILKCACVCVCACVRVCVCMRVCILQDMFGNMNLGAAPAPAAQVQSQTGTRRQQKCLCVCTHPHTHAHTWIHTHGFTYTLTHTFTHTFTHTHAHARARAHCRQIHAETSLNQYIPLPPHPVSLCLPVVLSLSLSFSLLFSFYFSFSSSRSLSLSLSPSRSLSLSISLCPFLCPSISLCSPVVLSLADELESILRWRSLWGGGGTSRPLLNNGSIGRSFWRTTRWGVRGRGSFCQYGSVWQWRVWYGRGYGRGVGTHSNTECNACKQPLWRRRWGRSYRSVW